MMLMRELLKNLCLDGDCYKQEQLERLRSEILPAMAPPHDYP